MKVDETLLDRSTIAEVQELGAGDSSFWNGLVQTYESKSLEALSKFEASCKAHDANASAAFAHKLKGMSRQIGARAVADAMATCEVESKAAAQAGAKYTKSSEELAEMRQLLAKTLEGLRSTRHPE